MTNVGGKHKLVGFVDLGKGHELMTALSGKTNLPILICTYCQFRNIPSCISHLKRCPFGICYCH